MRQDEFEAALKGSPKEKLEAAQMALKMVIRCAEDHSCPQEAFDIAVEEAYQWLSILAWVPKTHE